MTNLKCPGVGRDKDHDRALCFYFNRPVTDREMRFLHEVMQRAAETMPTPSLRYLFDENNCPGHVALPGNAKVCGRCGVHVDSFRPDED